MAEPPRRSYEALVERGCLCGTDLPQDCGLHGPSDNRGLRAFFEANMPMAFPCTAFCALCGAEGLMYPSVELDRGDVPAGEAPGPTLVCPSCSSPVCEMTLRAEAEEFGYVLNGRSVFGSAAGVVA
jgi:hypothetical protein